MSNNYEELARRAKNVNQPQDIRQTVRIVVTTPTGRIGHQVLDNVLDSTEAIRVIVRDPSRLSPRVRERVEVVQGSHDDLDVVTKAFAGADCVFWLVVLATWYIRSGKAAVTQDRVCLHWLQRDVRRG